MKVILPENSELELPDGATGLDAARAIVRRRLSLFFLFMRINQFVPLVPRRRTFSLIEQEPQELPQIVTASPNAAAAFLPSSRTP